MKIEPKEQFQKLCEECLEKIDAIDKDTPWSEEAPVWWHKMREIERLILTTKKSLE